METYRRRWQGELHLNQISFFYHFPKRKLCMKIEINTNSWRHCLRLLKWAIYCIVYLNRNFNRNEKLCYIIFTFESFRYLFKIQLFTLFPESCNGKKLTWIWSRRWRYWRGWWDRLWTGRGSGPCASPRERRSSTGTPPSTSPSARTETCKRCSYYSPFAVGK